MVIFSIFFSGVQFLKELCFWEIMHYACLFHMFFLVQAFFELEMIQFDYWNLFKPFETANYKRIVFVWFSHGTRHGVGQPPHACKPRSSINGSLGIGWTCSNGGVVWPKFRQLATTVTIYGLKPSHLTHITIAFKGFSKISWHVAFSITPQWK